MGLPSHRLPSRSVCSVTQDATVTITSLACHKSFGAATRFDVGESVAPGDPRNIYYNFSFCMSSADLDMIYNLLLIINQLPQTYQAFLCLRCTDFAISRNQFRRMRWSFEPVENADSIQNTA